jgi:hypothetical protein
MIATPAPLRLGIGPQPRRWLRSPTRQCWTHEDLSGGQKKKAGKFAFRVARKVTPTGQGKPL